MFYEGSLQEAIQTALAESKLVVCFVTDDGPESIRWEAEFLTDEAIKDKLASQAVSLRLEAGSQEAGYLEALFPVPRKPTMVMIHNGALKEYIAPGLAKEEFLQRTLKALGYASPETPATAAAVAPSPATASTAQVNQAAAGDDDDLYGDSAAQPCATPAPTSEEATGTTPSESPSSPEQVRTTAMLAERAKRLEADKKAKDAKEKAEREARSKARKESSATDASSTTTSNTNTNTTTHDMKPAERKHAQEVRQQKILDREHRQRILKRIEDDRRERKERDAKEKQARLLLNATEDPDPSSSSSAAQIPLTTRLTESNSKSTSKDGKGAETIKYCAVQVRLFDGSVIRARFPSDSTLEKDVRSWIDEDRTDEGGGRYTFRHVLTPLPNKAISSDEEKDKTLQELGMSPSATLVLVPVNFATAYHENPRGDVLGRALWPIVYLLGSGWRMLSGFLGLLFGRGGGRDDGGARAMGLEPTRGGGAAAKTTSSSRRKDEDGVELKERGKKKKEKKMTGEGEQNYDNGNSLSFEPRHDDSEDDEE